MNRPRIVVDIGNSTVKLGVIADLAAGAFPSWVRLLEFKTPSFEGESLRGHLAPEPRAWRVVSVNGPAEERLSEWLRQTRPADDYRRLCCQDLPIEIDVEFPDRVGMDRLAAAVAANRLRHKDRPAVVVDAGTAITVDAVSTSGVFLGGVILPGFRMATRSLAADTDLLPLVDATFAAPPAVIGRSTAAAIRSGIFWGGVGAIRQLVGAMTRELGATPQLFLTGGDAALLSSHVDDQASFVPELVLAGIAWAAA
jgi:type III pantothenate kinase